jgi:beta-mannosidase
VFSIRLRGGIISQHETLVATDGLAEVSISLINPELWYPHGYGAQTLYDITVDVSKGEFQLDTMSKWTGSRRGELVKDDDKPGQSFYFRINGIDLFCAGSCWIPADNFIPHLTTEKYRKWVGTMIDGNQVMTRCVLLTYFKAFANMIRVWGGGIEEEEVFYDLCDELGILVWQDFMFGCGSYPTWPKLLDSIREEAICNVRRLRYHPSIVIYAGNNEEYQIQEQYKLEYNFADKDPELWL